jgi:hypothetical protein
MSLGFLICAILGSAIGVFAGGPPARRILAKIQNTWPRNDR